MIIFGTRGYLYQLAIMTLVCGRCGNPSAHTLRKRVTKFTLFFVPLFPISSKYATQCTFCGASKKATRSRRSSCRRRPRARTPPSSTVSRSSPSSRTRPEPGAGSGAAVRRRRRALPRTAPVRRSPLPYESSRLHPVPHR